jgi:hypothetical protein
LLLASGERKRRIHRNLEEIRTNLGIKGALFTKRRRGDTVVGMEGQGEETSGANGSGERSRGNLGGGLREEEIGITPVTGISPKTPWRTQELKQISADCGVCGQPMRARAYSACNSSSSGALSRRGDRRYCQRRR